jgi:hypothetical protein
VSPVKYELGSYIQEDDILHSHSREDVKSYRLHLVAIVKSKFLCFEVCSTVCRSGVSGVLAHVSEEETDLSACSAYHLPPA